MNRGKSLVAVLNVTLFLIGASGASAHCDGLDGPVVAAARDALAMGEIERALIWVGDSGEAEVRAAFAETLAVRTLGEEARKLADKYFFETVVRLHRQGEGASYTGLKPAGRDLGPAIPAADQAIESGSDDALFRLLAEAVEEELDSHFEAVMASKDFLPDDVAAGRKYVRAYVSYIHFAERLYNAAKAPAESHGEEH